jgi:hypothetical protein
VESNGLDGKPYAVAMVVYRNNKPTRQLCLATSVYDLNEPIDQWLLDYPHLQSVPGAELVSYRELLSRSTSFFKYYAAQNDQDETQYAWGNPNVNFTPILYHCGMVVEGNFFRTLVDEGYLGKFERPMAAIEVADYLRLTGENPHSVDEYCEKFGLDMTQYETHNPLADAIRAANTFIHIQNRL